MKIIILAGGTGTRFWPLTRSCKPKQLCKLISEKTMLEETLARFKGWPKEKVFISTTQKLLPQIKKILPDFSRNNYIVEPALRDTAPAMGYVAVCMAQIDSDEPIVFIPADHFIGNEKKFLLSIKEAEKVILDTGKLLDISVAPTSPATTLGYTKIGKLVRRENSIDFYEFLGHKEKPNFKTAQKYLAEGDYLWHANYYMWTPKQFLESYKKYAPKMWKTLMAIKKLLGKKESGKKIAKLYDQMEKISIDYAITEKMNSQEMLIIKGDFAWDDIGAWDTLYQNSLSKVDADKNLIFGQSINIDTRGCVILGDKKKMIATIGLENIVIVDTEDALLICPKSHSQEVKKIIEKLKNQRKQRYL